MPIKLHVLAAATLSAAVALTLSGCATDSAPTTASTVAPVATVEPSALRSPGTLTYCTTNLGSPPNISTDASGALVGSEIDMAKGIAERLGLKPDFVTVDFAALIPSLQASQCDAIMATLYIKPAREEVVDFVPYLTSAVGVAVKDGSNTGVTGLDDSLCGKKVMVTVGTTAQSLAEDQSTKCSGEGKQTVDISTNNQATIGFQQLANGQIDAYIDAAELIGYYQKQGTAGISIVGEPTSPATIGAATRKDDKALHDGIQLAFTDMVASGDYAKILDTWGQSSVALKTQG
ncbi:hypothetical protein B7R21_17465 [Subtercola boreus]|uniref:Solute-binding protein family 3/N-terminal domain-containing protein n=1 Tax=Subtercola boreus TaxID=120213 RepID=A0A3E0VDF2_9MICO|nr:ABC transporter substrate-binding protein [Subtercola boreus]RFA06907.1 hypothetical protein B7R21_17465 [Subtercola boreus]